MKYNLGLDLGITSIGWSIVGVDDNGDSTHIIDANVTILESIEDDKGKLNNVERRNARGIRRTVRRRKHRVSRVKNLLKTIGVDAETIYNISGKEQFSPYYLKVKGLKEKLNSDELAICLIHYAKHRGFKSNRNNADVEDEGDLLNSISLNKKELLEHNKTVSEYLYEKVVKYNGVEKIKNSAGNYNYLFDRQTYLDEIEVLLKKQVEFELITEDFKEKYIKIWSSQRDFSEGPGGDSKYKVDFAKSFGYCKFRINGERVLRAPKCAPTTEIFTLLQKLTNIRYSFDGEQNIRLSSREIEEALDEAKKTETLKYSHIKKILSKDVEFQGTDISRDKFIKLVTKYKVNNKIPMEEKIDFKDVNFVKELNKEKLSIVVGKLNNYHKLKKVFKIQGYEDTFKSMPIEFLDDIVTGLTFYKTENRINNYFLQEGNQEQSLLDWSLYPRIVSEVITHVAKFNESANLSLEIMRKLNPLLLKGNDYYEAMNELGYDHSAPVDEIKKSDKLPDMSVVERDFPNELTNPRVTRVLAATMSLINSIIERYGMPENIHVETARDIANIRDKRNKIFTENMKNFEYNQKLKFRVAELSNRTIDKVSKEDVEKLKLFDEQNEVCMYSMEKIDISSLFTTDVQVDHIVPYSRSYDNSFSNKTLVKTKYNQDKGNKTPYEYFNNSRKSDYSKFVNLVESNFKLSNRKKQNYLTKEITEEFKSRSLNDTSFITKYFIKIIKTYLNIGGNVVGYKAGIINSLKKAWGLEYLTHSYINKDYSDKDLGKFKKYDINKDSLTLVFESEIEPEDVKVTLKLVQENDNTTKDVIEQNKHLQNILKNSSFIADREDDYKGLPLFKIFEKITATNELNQDLKTSYIIIFNALKIEYNKLQIKKNRNNHLHHVLDATCVAILNRKYEKRVTKYYQELEMMKVDAVKCFDENKEYIIKYTEEVVHSYEELVTKLDFIWKDQFPKPYEKFDKEILYRIYEQDIEKQKKLFEENFNDGLTRNIRPVFPVYKAKKRKTMKLHKETYYGIEQFDDGEYLTKRIDVNKITKASDIQKIVEVKKGNRQLEEIFNIWIEKKQTEYPLLPNGRPIKKVKVIDRTSEKSIKISEGKYVAIDKVARIDIYTSPNDDRLYFVQRNPVSLKKELLYKFKNGEDFKLQLWWGQSKNNKMIFFSELENYAIYKKIQPGKLIYIKTDNGEGFCYSVGFSSGMFEVKSILGDGTDLVDKCIVGKVKKQYQLSVSTIKKIEKVSVNNLGELGKHF